MMLGSLPALDTLLNANHSPHVVILGAGASRAACPVGDKNGRVLPLMADLMSVIDLKDILPRALRATASSHNFESVYGTLAESSEDLAHEVEQRVRSYLGSLQLPSHVTVYDLLVLTLRSKDLIATFNWDPFLLQALERNHDVAPMPTVAFLHGGVGLGFCGEHRVKGLTPNDCPSCRKPLEEAPILLPIKTKGYRTHLLLSAEWDLLSETLEHAYLLTIFGYAAPASDVEARDIMFKAWKMNRVRSLARIEVIDVLGRRVLEARWQDFVLDSHWGARRRFSGAMQALHPRRSCEGYASATLQQDPWSYMPVPRFRRLDRLQEWIKPLVREEEELEHGTPFKPFGRAS